MNTRRNILYRELYDDLIDRLDNFGTPSGPAGEFMKQKKKSPVVIAQAATAGMIDLLRRVSFQAIPDLVEALPLQQEIDNGNTRIHVFPLPEQALTERQDMGIIRFVINGEQVDFNSSVGYETLFHSSRSLMYSGSENIFHVSIESRRLYTLCKDVKAIILKKPHSIYAPSQKMFAGSTITHSAPESVSDTILFFDGAGNSIEIEITDTDTIGTRHVKIANGINGSDEIMYRAVLPDDDSFVQLKHKYTYERDTPLKPQVAPAGTGVYTVEDTGTYEIPIPYHYFNEISLLSFNHLVGRPTEPQEDTDE